MDTLRSYWEDRFEKQPGLTAVGIKKLGKAYNYWLYRFQGFVFDSLISEKFLPLQAQKVLDLGAGTGFFSKKWIQHGAKSVVVTDISDRAIATLLLNLSGVKGHQLDIAQEWPAELKNKSFDVVSAMAVLFHLKEDEQYIHALRSINQSLQMGGTFIFSENLLYSGERVLEHMKCRERVWILKQLQESGFEILCIRPIAFFLNAPGSLQTSCYTFFWKATVAPCVILPFWGHMIGALYFMLDRWLWKRIARTPSSYVLCCRKMRELPT